MIFEDVIGHQDVKKHLTNGIKTKNIPHAQIFVGKEGCGSLPMAIAYAKELINTGNQENNSFSTQLQRLEHPDLHFHFPVATNDKVKTKPLSKDFYEEWRSFVLKNPYGGLYDWLKFIGVENKQGFIGVDESKEILKNLSLKSYGGGYNVTIIWHIEKMHAAAANKLLKTLEEPPKNSIFLLVAEDEQELLKTIKSRCQALYFSPYTEQQIADELVRKKYTDISFANKISKQANGNFNKALQLLNQDEVEFEKWFVSWVRSAFKAKKNAAAIRDLIAWSEMISTIGREHQIKFLKYCLEFFRQSLLLNYGVNQALYLESSADFDLNKFAPFVHGSNIAQINHELNEAMLHIERNGNAKIVLLDCSIKLTRLLHQKQSN